MTRPWPAVVLFCGVIGFLAPASYGLLNGVREPGVHDEFSYLLGASTFAQGRLSNPTPALPEFFEAPHVLVEPTYNSKYPPAQAVMLAIGYRIFGHPDLGSVAQLRPLCRVSVLDAAIVDFSSMGNRHNAADVGHAGDVELLGAVVLGRHGGSRPVEHCCWVASGKRSIMPASHVSVLMAARHRDPRQQPAL